MRLYLDDDSASSLLTRLLQQARHDVRLPSEVSMAGEDDPVHLAQAIREDRVLLSHNHHDFEDLHNLLMVGRGHHPGILVVRKDNNPKRDLAPPGIVRTIGKLLAAGVEVTDHFYVLNHWR
jgi:predicted nuclease of predicted toxin-antitoxin system